MRLILTKRQLAVSIASALFALGSSVALAQDSDTEEESEEEAAKLTPVVF